MAKTKRKKSRKKKKNLNKKIYSLITLIVSFFILISINSYMNLYDFIPTWQSLAKEIKTYINDDLKISRVMDTDSLVHYIDVGQGSSILIQSGDKNVLIDGGETNQSEKVVSYIKAQNIQMLEYVVATHPHSDHIGGLIGVLENFNVSNVIMPQLPASITPTTRVYENFLNLISQKNINVIPSSVGSKYELGEGYMYVLAPSSTYDDLNNMSIAIKYTYGDISFLSTGDMEEKAEKDLIKTGYNLSAQVFALSHHGSKYGNIQELLDKINPIYCVAQCGADNEYGHPNNEVLDRVASKDATLLRSDINGDIVFTTNGSELKVTTQKE